MESLCDRLLISIKGNKAILVKYIFEMQVKTNLDFFFHCSIPQNLTISTVTIEEIRIITVGSQTFLTKKSFCQKLTLRHTALDIFYLIFSSSFFLKLLHCIHMVYSVV